jgi:hypothetical protein
LHSIANPAYLTGFLFSGLPRVAPYCARGGVRVVSNITLVATERCRPQDAREKTPEEEAERLKELLHRVERAKDSYRRDECEETRERYGSVVKEYHKMRHLI